LLLEFPTKSWSISGLNRLLRKIDKTGSAEKSPGQGRKRSVRTQENTDDVADLVQDNNPQTHRTQREISRELGISKGSVNRIVRKRSAAAVIQETQGIRVNCSQEAIMTATCKETVEVVSI